jgi:hypothetical protein
MRMHITQTAQPIRRHSKAPEIGEENALVVSNNNVLNTPFPVDEHAELAFGLKRQLTEVTRQLVGNNLLCRYFATVNMLDASHLIGF